MKWFQHFSDSYSNLKILSITGEFGNDGYAVIWYSRELVAHQGNNYRIPGPKGWKKVLLSLTRLSPDTLDRILEKCAEVNLIDSESLKSGDLYIPKMIDYSDDYTDKVWRKFGQGKDNVPVDKIRLDKIRLDKIREKERATKYLSKIPKNDLEEFIKRFGITKAQIEDKAEDLLNYCRSKGKFYKNYKAFMLNALKRDFGVKPSKLMDKYQKYD